MAIFFANTMLVHICAPDIYVRAPYVSSYIRSPYVQDYVVCGEIN